MSKIVKFDIDRKSQKNRQETSQSDGYDYFAKAVLDSLCEDEEDGEDYLVQVINTDSIVYQITDAFLDRENKTVTLIISN